jgi:hypothetical protein
MPLGTASGPEATEEVKGQGGRGNMEREPSKTAFTPGYVKDPYQDSATGVPPVGRHSNPRESGQLPAGNRAVVAGITPGLRQSCQGGCEF